MRSDQLYTLRGQVYVLSACVSSEHHRDLRHMHITNLAHSEIVRW